MFKPDPEIRRITSMASARPIARAIARWVWRRRKLRVFDEKFELDWLLWQMKHPERPTANSEYNYKSRFEWGESIEDLVSAFYYSFEKMKKRYDSRRRWWRQQNLLAEEKRSEWGEGLIHEWTEIIRKIQQPPEPKDVSKATKKNR